MNHVSCIAWRFPCPGFGRWGFVPSNQWLCRTACRELRVSPPLRPFSVDRRSFASQTSPRPRTLCISTCWRRLSPISVPFRWLKTPAGSRNEPVERGVQLHGQPFSPTKINAIFGHGQVSPNIGNRLLAVLQGRRIAGTLDLELPTDITRSVYQTNIDTALQWLRENYPYDEDAAIIARIEREEREEEEKLIRRAEQLGLYKPQSGSYENELGENDDISGKSVLKEARKQNEARRREEEERDRREWLEGEAQDRAKLQHQIQQNTALQKAQESAITEARPRADPRERPALAWIQKHHLRGTNLDIDLSHMTTARRLLPSLAVAIMTMAICYLFAQNYKTPKRDERMWPNTPPAAATVMALIGINLGIFLLWKFPPAWRTLNRYFIVTSLYPYGASIIGSAFSHQKTVHALVNMAALWLMGTKVHDDIGRGNFLAIYMASGVLSSFTSLAAHVLAGNLRYTSLGASGAVCGLVATWLMVRSNDVFTFYFLPRELDEIVKARGSTILAAVVGFEIISILSPWKFTRLDNWGHLGGYIAGAASGYALKARMEKDRRKKRSWWGNLTE